MHIQLVHVLGARIVMNATVSFKAVLLSTNKIRHCLLTLFMGNKFSFKEVDCMQI